MELDVLLPGELVAYASVSGAGWTTDKRAEASVTAVDVDVDVDADDVLATPESMPFDDDDVAATP